MEKISVLIPTYNASRSVNYLLEKLNEQILPSNYQLEIIIMDSSSQDKTREFVRNKFPEVKLKTIKKENFGHGKTRNELQKISEGEFILFMTQDALPKNNKLILNLFNSFKDSKVAIAYARQIPYSNANQLEKFARNFNYPGDKIIKTKNNISELGIKTFFNSNVCSMYRTQEFLKAGGFEENLILNEDMVLASNLILKGYKVVYNSEAMVSHSHNYNLKQQFKRYFDIGMAFRQTSHLLKYASNEDEGKKMLITILNHLHNKRKYYLIPLILLEFVSKYSGYILGKNYKILPKYVRKKVSAYTN